MTLADALAAAETDRDHPAALAALRARLEEHLWEQFPFMPDATQVDITWPLELSMRT